jgi:hypothetical protein
MTLKEELILLANDFRSIPDRDKDFPALQDRLEVLLKQVHSLTEEEKKPLYPLLQQFHAYLQEHLAIIRQEASKLQEILEDKKTHKEAISAYSKTKGR